MRWIEKDEKNEPKSLKLHRQKSFSDYDNYAEKDDLRLALLQEQGYLCCYCMNRIQTPSADKMKIEHWKPQHAFKDLQLDYGNLFASCLGNEWSDVGDFHCDKNKGEDIITLSPRDKVLIEKIIFGRKGDISIPDVSSQKDLTNTLNLNFELLKHQREGVYKGVTQFLQKEFGRNKPSKSVLNREIKKWSEKKNGKFEPFCQIAVYFLTKALSNAE